MPMLPSGKSRRNRSACLVEQDRHASALIRHSQIRYAVAVVIGYCKPGRVGPAWKRDLSLERPVPVAFEEAQITLLRVDGLTEELTTAFMRIPSLRVIAPPSAAAARAHSVDIRAIGRDLNVAAVLTGSVERSTGGIKVVARLASVDGNRTLWSEAFQTKTGDISSVEAPIVRAAARGLGLTAPEASWKTGTPNPEAHDLYIQGRYLWSRRDADNVRKSIALFERALENDPNYALAYTGLADAYGVMAANDFLPTGEALPKAEAAAAHALALAPESAEARASLGLIKNAEWDWKGAERELRLALKFNSGYAATYQRLALNATVHGRFEEAEALLRRAQTVDPLNWMLTYNLGENAYYARRYDEAIAQANKIRSVMPGQACNLLERSYFHKGMIADARSAADCEFQGRDDSAAKLIRTTLIEGPAGASCFRSLVAQPLPDVGPFFIAGTAARLRQTDLALDWLEKALTLHTPDLASIRVEPDLDAVRNEPRFQDLVKKVGL
jgi:TolB-like protein/tetratricopeptide (TPR) repeat protein